MKKKLYTILLVLSGILISTTAYAQQKYAIKGVLVDKTTKQPIEMATVVVNEQMAWATTNDKGEFVINNVMSGNIVLSISCLGYEKAEQKISLIENILDLKVSLASLSLGLDEITVTAKESEMGSSSKIEQTALEHIQAQSLSDVLQLVPGQTTENPSFEKATQMKIREINDDNNSALGAALIINGTPVSNNANFQVLSTAKSGNLAEFSTVAGKGIDLRDYSTDNIESIEVIRGIPSVEYGDLTSGAMVIKTKTGKTPLEAKISVNPNTKSYYVGKGFSLGENKGTVNINGDYTSSYPEKRKKQTGYKRFTGGVAYSNTFFKDAMPLSVNFTSNLFSTVDDKKSDPEIDENEEFRAGNKGIRLALFGKLALNEPWITNLNYNVSYNYTHQESYAYEFQSLASGVQPLATSYENGEHAASFVPSMYYSEMTIDGKPFNFFAQLKANNSSYWGKIFNNLLVGAECRISGNNGNGKNYDLERPPIVGSVSTIRPRAFKDIPNLTTFSAFAQDKVKIPLGKTQATLQAGLRFAMIQPFSDLDRVKLKSIEPRINASYQILNNENNSLFKNLSITMGYGIATKMPTLLHLYPDPAYLDVICLNYYDEKNISSSMAVLDTRIIEDTSNPDLKPIKNRKTEVGIEFALEKISGSIKGYYEKQTDGYAFIRQDVFFAHREYEVSGNNRNPYYVEGGGVYYYDDDNNTVQASYRMDTDFCKYNMPVNDQTLIKKGLEYNFDLGKIKPIATKVIIDGAWLNTKSFNTKAYTESINSSDNGSTFPYIKLMPSGKTTIRNRFNTNIRTITHIPAIKMVFTLTTQIIWYESFRYEYNNGNNSRIFVLEKTDDGYTRIETNDVEGYTGDNIYKAVAPVGYYDKAGNYYDWNNSTELTEPYLSMLSRKSDSYYLPEEYSPTVQFNIKVSKEITDKITFAFNANNFLNIRPKEKLTRSSDYERRNSSIYFGAELKFKL